MKKILFITIFLSLSTSAIFSQGIEWGIKGGINVSSEKSVNTDSHGETYHTTNNYGGFYLGVSAEYTLSDLFGVQGELLYTEIMSEWTSGAKWNYFVLPVTGKVYLTKGFSVDLGPQLGYRLDAIGSERKFDLSLGAGLSCKIGRRFDVSARYNFGLIVRDKEFDGKNNTLRFGVGYRF